MILKKDGTPIQLKYPVKKDSQSVENFILHHEQYELARHLVKLTNFTTKLNWDFKFTAKKSHFVIQSEWQEKEDSPSPTPSEVDNQHTLDDEVTMNFKRLINLILVHGPDRSPDSYCEELSRVIKCYELYKQSFK